MAFLPETIVSALLDPVLNTLTSEFQLRRDVPKEVGKLDLTLSMIRRVIQDAEEKQINNPPVHEWLRALKEIILDADDVLDDYATRVALRSKGEDGSDPNRSNNNISIKRKVWKILTCSNLLPADVFTSGDIAHNIKDIRERLDNIDKTRSSLGLQAVSSGTRHFEITTRQTTSVLADESSMLGREEEKQKIIQLLLSSPNEAESSSNRKNFSILPIVGMGGVGKTTLAQLVFNDKKVKDHFPHLRMWVCISDDFNVARVTKEIIQSSSERNRDRYSSSNLDSLTSLDAIQHRLIEVVEGKQFLLVLDDVWNEDNSSNWKSLLGPLQSGGRGSKVIITTRTKKMADIIPGRMNPIYLEGLSNDSLWKIFKEFAFGDNQTEYRQFEVIGRQIVGRLKGLPLAAKTVGCLLNSNLNVEYWRMISQSNILTLDQGEDGILPSLKLSFQHLSGRVKQCFTYCSLFPKDYQFDKTQLVQLWTAQCMIQRERNLELEDVGSYYFDALLSRSFFQLYHYDFNMYVMHDLIHDLAEYESKDDCFRMGDGISKDIPETVRHISLLSDNLESSNVIALCRYKNLRTLLFLRRDKFDFSLVLDKLFTKLKRLRVLGLSSCEVKRLPESIGQLKHLRYIDLSNTPLEKLPDSLSNLHNLQVLNLQYCWSLHALPKGITKLINLRHLVAEESLISCIEGIENLTSLQELWSFDACKHKIREMKGMNQLRELRIKHLEHVEGKEEASQVELNSKKRLKVLELKWSNENRADDIISGENSRLDDEEVLEGLQPNADSLKCLIITGYAGTKFPSWMMTENQSFLFLERICLGDCRKVASLPPMGQVPFLKDLEIAGNQRIKQVGNEFYGNRQTEAAFPSLETLEFWNMSEWEVWKGADEGQSFFPCLRELKVGGCPKLMELLPMGQLPFLKELTIIGMTGIKQLGNEFYGNRQTEAAFPSLETLIIGDMSEWEVWKGAEEGQLFFPYLRRLEVRDCLKLMELPPLPPSMTELEMSNVGVTVLSGLQATRSSTTTTTTSQAVLSSSSSLKWLRIYRCPNLTSLLREEGLLACQLEALQDLKITDCEELVSLPMKGFGDLISLKYLMIRDCPKLEPLITSDGALLLPSSLESLSIVSCGDLGSSLLPCLPNCASLLELTIGAELLGGFLLVTEGLSRSLQYLEIYGGEGTNIAINNNNGSSRSSSFDEQLSRCLQQLTSLNSLHMIHCQSLTSLLPGEVARHLTALKHLQISNCQHLTSLELQSLTSLRDLTISRCPKLMLTTSSSSSPSTSSPSLPLVELDIYNSSQLFTGVLLQSFPSLEVLQIRHCENLQSLPTELGSLSSLKRLEILNCPQIQSLPDIKRLPASLVELKIFGCPRLKERCQEEGGPDWHKISHIPSIYIS